MSELTTRTTAVTSLKTDLLAKIKIGKCIADFKTHSNIFITFDLTELVVIVENRKSQFLSLAQI